MDVNSFTMEELDRVRTLAIRTLLTKCMGVGEEQTTPYFTFREKKEKKNPRKLNRKIARQIWWLSHYGGMTHRQIVDTVKETYGISIVPHTVSDIKLGKRWKGVENSE